MSNSSEGFDLADLKLQQELLQMFEVDSQKDLETYFTCVQNLQENSWKADTQTMYRVIHTIKGSSATVNANGIVEVATVLEDILSQLRYLNNIPPLEDGQLQQILVEGGEIIASVLSTQPEESAIKTKVEYLENLKQKIQTNYFENWQEKTQLQIEFVENGFDLIILDLEIALSQLSTTEIVPPEVIDLAVELIAVLTDVGTEIELESGWTKLLNEADELVDNPNAQFWKSEWSQLFSKLKTSALNGGKETKEEIETEAFSSQDITPNSKNLVIDQSLSILENTLSPLTMQGKKSVELNKTNSDLFTETLLDEIDLIDEEEIATTAQMAIDSNDNKTNSDLFTETLLDEIDLIDEEEIATTAQMAIDSSNSTETLFDEIDLIDEEEIATTAQMAIDSSNSTETLFDEIDLIDEEEIATTAQMAIDSNDQTNSDLFTETLLDEIDLIDEEEIATTVQMAIDSSDSTDTLLLDEIDLIDQESDEEVDWLSEQEISETTNISSENKLGVNKSTEKFSSLSVKPSRLKSKDEDIQVPISISKLDQSAQSIVDTLMIARAMEDSYQNLHQDLVGLISLAKDSVQYLAQLRHIQSDYTLLNDLDQKLPKNKNSPSIERYRQGYVTINRLLENNLRLSEIGTEAEQKAQDTTQKLEKLNKGIIQLKDIVEESRLIRFRNLTFRVRAIVRDLMTRYGKLVNLTIEGEQIELDVGTSRRLEPILLHLVRNAYDHGLETPTERKNQGKTEQGNLHLTLQRFGSNYVLELKDDGKGIDASQIKAKAKKLNLPLTNTDTPSELLSVISQSGFSSKSEISEVSGRGVGMDVVAQQVSLLDASWSLETALGKGTTFKVNFPVPHLLVSCLLVQSGEVTFAIPTEKIITTALWQDLKASPIDNSPYLYNWEIEYQEQKTLGLDLLKYWNSELKNNLVDERNSTNNTATAIAVYLQPQANLAGFWLLADKMLGRLELKIQPLPLPMIAPKGLMGVGLQTQTSLIPVIEPNSLQEYLNTELTPTITEDSNKKVVQSQTTNEESQTILIIDDAALMRRRIEASLSAYGYTTYTCSDGLEAWNWLNVNPKPILMITDIEMPNMDGFSLIDRCRQQKMNFPIMVISSRLAEEWGFEANRVGATDFLTKGFSTNELINRVNSLLKLKQ